MSKSAADRRRRRGSGRLALALAVALVVALARAAAPSAAAAQPAPVPPESGPSPHGTGFEITPAVRQQLHRIQEQWLLWVSAPDRAHSDAAVSEMLATAGQLGMARLPDLALGALAWAVDAARHRDFARAGWALAAAERLDPGRPETAFAEAAVARAEGSYGRYAAALAGAYPRLFTLPLERYLWLQDLLLWGLYLLLLTGGLFVVALLATRGGGLIHDLAALPARRLPRAAAVALAGAVLLWPLVLPGRLVWLLLLWSLLLWGYASASERAVLIGLWLLLGAAPLLIGAQQRAVAMRMSPPVKALESVRQRRLYGGLFTDLGLLRSTLPDSTAVKHLLADVHRLLGQWEIARGFYREVLAAEPQNSPALLNLGVYAFNRADVSGAIDFFQQAAKADPHNAAPPFDLSQAFDEGYLFDDARHALAQAKQIDAERVDRWLSNAEQERVVAGAGGLALIPDIERSLIGPAATVPALVQHGASLVLALAAILVAVALHLARRPFGYSEGRLQWGLGHGALDRLRRVLVPGLTSAESGDGATAYLALLAPAGLLMLPWFERVGYRIPWGYDAGNVAAWTLSAVGLLLYLAARLRWELRNAV